MTPDQGDDLLHDFRPSVYPGVDRLVKHLTDAHGIPRDWTFWSNIVLLHRSVHLDSWAGNHVGDVK